MRDALRIWAPTLVVFAAGSLATALVPLVVPILGPLSREFGIDGARLGWVVSLPSLLCAFGALLFGIAVDRVGDVRLLLAGVLLTILGDVGVSLAPHLSWLFAARLFQGIGYGCLSVAGPAFIQRTIAGETRRAAMALWASHTPMGFALAVFSGAQLVAAGLSWRYSFLGHAAVALLIGLAVLPLRRVPSAAHVRRSAATRQVLTSSRPFAVAGGACAAALLQTGTMVILPTLAASRWGLTGAQSALVVVVAMAANWSGAMIVVATGARRRPSAYLGLCAAVAGLSSAAILTQAAGTISTGIVLTLLFSIAVGAANALIWSLMPSAVPTPEAAGATSGLITQGSFLGVLTGPPLFFLLHERPAAAPVAIGALAALMLIALAAARTGAAEQRDDRGGSPHSR